MRKATCILPVLLLLLPAGGCSLFREVTVSRQDSSYTGSIKQSLYWKIDSTHLASRVFSFTDSSGAQFEVEIVPSGPFTFSAQTGFTGSASLLRLHGKTQMNIKSTDSSSQKLQVQSSGSLKQKVKVETNTKDVQKEKVLDNKSWWFLALLAAGILFVVGYSKVRKVTTVILSF